MWRHHAECFGCGATNESGLRLEFTTLPGPELRATVTLGARFCGPPGLVHGGILATVLDEALAQLPPALGVVALTRELSVRYLRRVPVGTTAEVVARVRARSGRTLELVSSLVGRDGKVLAEASGTFEEIDPGSLAPR